MKIFRIKENKAKVVLNKNDMEEIGIAIDDLDTDESLAKLFVAGIISMLKDFGMFDKLSGDITVDIAQKSNNETIVFVTMAGNRSNFTNNCVMCSFNDSNELTQFCKLVHGKFKQDIKGALLFYFKGAYFLIMYFRKEPPVFNKAKVKFFSDPLKIGKIKEYGELLTRTPFEKILKI